MITLWIGIFLVEIKGLISLPANSQLNLDFCNCSLRLITLEHRIGNEYLISFSQEEHQYSRELLQIEYVSNNTGKKVEILRNYYTDDGIIIINDQFLENDIYTLYLTYSYNKNCSNCTAALSFKTLEKNKKNVPFFVGIVAVVSLMIIAMCFYNIRSKCIYRFIQEIKRLPLLLNRSRKNSTEFETNNVTVRIEPEFIHQNEVKSYHDLCKWDRTIL